MTSIKEHIVLARYGQWGWQLSMRMTARGRYLTLTKEPSKYIDNFRNTGVCPTVGCDTISLEITGIAWMPLWAPGDEIKIDPEVIAPYKDDLHKIGLLTIIDDNIASSTVDSYKNVACPDGMLHDSVFHGLVHEIVHALDKHMQNEMFLGNLDLEHMRCVSISPAINFGRVNERIQWTIGIGHDEAMYVNTRGSSPRGVKSSLSNLSALMVNNTTRNVEYWCPNWVPPLKRYDNGKLKPLVVAVEGNVGSNKSQFMDRFEGYSNIEVIERPVKKWQNVAGQDLLHNSSLGWDVQDLQNYAMLTLLENFTKKNKNTMRIMKGSIPGIRNCFMKVLFDLGVIKPAGFKVFNEWAQFIDDNTHIDTQVDIIVYLRSDPKRALARVKARNRKDETHIDLDYLQRLDKLYERWLISREPAVTAQVLIINVDRLPADVEYVSRKVEKLLVSLVRERDPAHDATNTNLACASHVKSSKTAKKCS